MAHWLWTSPIIGIVILWGGGWLFCRWMEEPTSRGAASKRDHVEGSSNPAPEPELGSELDMRRSAVESRGVAGLMSAPKPTPKP